MCSGGEGRKNSEGKSIAEEGDLLNPQGAAGSSSVEREWFAGNSLGGSDEGLRGGNVEIPEGGIHGGSEVRH